MIDIFHGRDVDVAIWPFVPIGRIGDGLCGETESYGEGGELMSRGGAGMSVGEGVQGGVVVLGEGCGEFGVDVERRCWSCGIVV